MTSAFRLLHLPLLVLRNVFDRFHLDAIVKLSWCSKRTMQLTKFIMKNDLTKVKISVKFDLRARVDLSKVRVKDTVSKKWQINADIREYASVTILNLSELPTNEKFEMVKVGDQAVPSIKIPEKTMQVYFGEKFEGLKKVLEHFTSLFEVPIEDLLLASNMYPNQIRSMIDWTLTKQSSIESVYIECDLTSEKAASDTLDVIHFTKWFSIKFKPSKEFRHYFTFENDSIEIYDAYWISLNNLFAINCRTCYLSGTNFSCQEMNQFLRHWINGGFNKTIYVFIELKSRNFPRILEGLNAVYVEKKRIFTKDDLHFHIWSGFDIQRTDGKIATIIKDHLRHLFRMVVW